MDTHRNRILVADDHTLLRCLLAELISAEADMEVVGQAADGLQTLELVRTLRPDLVLLDLYMPGMTGLECMSRIRAEVPEAVVIVLSHSTDEEDVLAAFRAGAHGYLLKTMEPEKLLSRIRDAAHGELPIAAEVARCILDRLEMTISAAQPCNAGRKGPENPLTPRETEIVSLIAGGATNREIGLTLMLSLNTVKNHIKHILDKLHVQNRTQVAAWATRSGMSGEHS